MYTPPPAPVPALLPLPAPPSPPGQRTVLRNGYMTPSSTPPHLPSLFTAASSPSSPNAHYVLPPSAYAFVDEYGNTIVVDNALGLYNLNDTLLPAAPSSSSSQQAPTANDYWNHIQASGQPLISSSSSTRSLPHLHHHQPHHHPYARASRSLSTLPPSSPASHQSYPPSAPNSLLFLAAPGQVMDPREQDGREQHRKRRRRKANEGVDLIPPPPSSSSSSGRASQPQPYQPQPSLFREY